MANELAKKMNIGDQVIARIESLSQVGFCTPKDYNAVNAVKASYLKLQELKDKNGRPALEVCTPASIQSALFSMVTRGLDASKSQCYMLVYGNQLAIQESYFGKVLRVRRIFPNFDPKPRIVHEGDKFEFTVDINTGKQVLVKHETKLENLDNDFIAAYLYIPTLDGGQDLYIMTKKEIVTAWSKSQSKEHRVAKEFPAKMIGKTIISSACTLIINATPDLITSNEDEDNPNYKSEVEEKPYEEVETFVEAETIEEVEEKLEKPKKEKKVKEEVKAEDIPTNAPNLGATPDDSLPFGDNDEF